MLSKLPPIVTYQDGELMDRDANLEIQHIGARGDHSSSGMLADEK
jgi:hypothetical protein